MAKYDVDDILIITISEWWESVKRGVKITVYKVFDGGCMARCPNGGEWYIPE